MATPTTRSQFKEYCLRKLGKPVIEINVDEDQVDDRVDEALRYYWDYHFDGNDKTYYRHQITADDITNKYITIPENIIGAINVFPWSSTMSTSYMFDIRYQLAMSDLFTFQNTSIVPYVMAMQHIAFFQEMLIGQKPIRYNRHKNRLHVDMNWDLMSPGEYFVIEAYEIVDPDTYTNVWSDRWLLEYCTELIKQNWGQNLKKFSGMALPGNMTFNGQVIYNEATASIKELRDEMINSYSLPSTMLIG